MKIADSDLVPKFMVAYSGDIASYAEGIYKTISDLGFNVYSMADNRTSENFAERIREELRNRDCLIPVLGEELSIWVEHEIRDAKEQGHTIFPILAGPDAKRIQFPGPLSRDNVQVQMESPDEPGLAEKLIRGMVDLDLFEKGIIPRRLLEACRRFSANPFSAFEQFAFELIEQPLVIKRTGKKITLQLDRRSPESCEYVAISNEGKKNLQSRFVEGRREELAVEDAKIFQFMTGRSTTPTESEPVNVITTPRGLPLRWASGGVLPIVDFRGRTWVAMLFRDIPPYGWNLPLGASERYFSADDQQDATQWWEEELARPLRLVTREFLEEVLVLNAEPAMENDAVVRRFKFLQELREFVDKKYSAFNSQHIGIRMSDDLLLGLKQGGKSDGAITVIDTKSRRYTVKYQTNSESGEIFGFSVCINLLEMGIEMIMPFHFSLEENDYLLDGEILMEEGKEELVRMPMALFSIEYLRRAFPPDQELKYEAPKLGKKKDKAFRRDQQAPSIGVTAPLTEDDVHLFGFDADRRREIAARKEKGREKEWKRHKNWVSLFGDRFSGSADQLPIFFTPATAKTLQMVLPTLPDSDLD